MCSTHTKRNRPNKFRNTDLRPSTIFDKCTYARTQVKRWYKSSAVDWNCSLRSTNWNCNQKPFPSSCHSLIDLTTSTFYSLPVAPSMFQWQSDKQKTHTHTRKSSSFRSLLMSTRSGRITPCWCIECVQLIFIISCH